MERTNESAVISSARVEARGRLEMLDVAGAILAAERATGSKVLGDAADGGDLGAALNEACALAGRGERAAIVAPAERLASFREGMRRVAVLRHGVVAHAIAGTGAEDLSALTDLGWGVLTAAGPEDSFDLSLVARRAAEDSGVPFVVVHGLGRAAHAAGRAVAMVGLPQERAIQAFVGGQGRSEGGARASAGDRAYAERVPFALGAALREYGTVSGRRLDVFDKVPLGESPLVLVGAGPVGDAVLCAIGELRARGYDVGAVQISSLRPFPGPRLVKALARALAITILEPFDEPLAHGSLLARDVKSAFTDALTWVPGFPGIGRIPKLFVGAVGPAFDVSDLAAVCENMLADERGRRVFSFLDVEHGLARAPQPSEPDASRTDQVAIRFVLDDPATAEAVLAAVGGALSMGAGLRTQGIVTQTAPGASAVLDVLASRNHARGGMARRAARLVIATERGVTSAGAVVLLPEGAVLGILGVEPSANVPEAARTVVRERRARVLPLATGGGDAGPSALVAVSAGAALAAAARVLKLPIDGSAAAQIVVASLRGSAESEATAQRARRAFEATRDVLAAPRAEPDPGRPVGVA